MSQISNFRTPWRVLLMSEPASFRGVIFHVENGGRSGGRRTVLHEYPKRSTPYSEDMGRQALRFQFSGYLVYFPIAPNTPEGSLRYDYVSQRTRLYEALEDDGPARLVHPVFCKNGMSVMCERYTMTESRERGGYTQFEMQFVETGSPVKSSGVQNLKSLVQSSALEVEKSALDLMPKDS